jgi:DNA-binding GntR family transcriptional regulator
MNLDQGRADEHAALLAVAREGSFVAAAAALERHSTVISRRIRRSGRDSLEIRHISA